LASVSRGTVAVVCVGPVTAERARSVGFESCIEPANARLGAMVQALVSAFSNRVVEVDLDGTPVLMQGRMVSVGDGEPVRLTERERAVLGLLAKRPGAVVSKQTLLEQVWAGESDDHVVEVTIGRLRRRLGDAGGSIETVVRRGYRLAVR
ncbi:MAG TPA: winged helix-turn-helix domain-containing protein, partial [Microthrixaceae bacterium]|nr:winged helix-turn-helix domain-containing protein [Microthrixaceae bacterium]